MSCKVIWAEGLSVSTPSFQWAWSTSHQGGNFYWMHLSSHVSSLSPWHSQNQSVPLWKDVLGRKKERNYLKEQNVFRVSWLSGLAP